MKNIQLLRFSSDTDLATVAAKNWLERIAGKPHETSPFLVALSGGRITKTLFSAVVLQAKAGNVPLQNVHFFWADERCLPPDDAESNFRMARELLFTPLKIASAQIHRLKGEVDPATAIREAINELSALAPANRAGQPVFDLILLGMGEDGHVASLFPNASLEVENCRAPYLFIENSPKPPLKRISLSYDAVAAAREVWALVSGKGKETALRESLEQNGKTPLAKVLQRRPMTALYTDLPDV